MENRSVEIENMENEECGKWRVQKMKRKDNKECGKWGV